MIYSDDNSINSSDENYDICIIGSGPAGMSVALEFENTEFDICVLESGEMEVSETGQSLNEGEIGGYLRESLTASRARVFGGTSAFWAGYCAPMDDDDFHKKEWLSTSGWPILKKDLEQYYKAASSMLDLGVVDFNPGSWENEKFRLAKFKNNNVDHKMVAYSPPTRMGKKYSQLLEKSTNIDVYLGCTVTDINASGRIIKRCIAKTRTGFQKNINASIFILAAGGIENPRNLLLWEENHPRLFSKDVRNNIGSYFAVHPHLPYGSLLLTGDAADSEFYKVKSNYIQQDGANVRVSSFFQINPEIRSRNKWVNVAFKLRKPVSLDNSNTYNNKLLEHLSRSRFQMYDKLQLTSDMHLSPRSKISLSNAKDSLGMKKPRVNFYLAPETVASWNESLIYFVRELGANGYGRVRFPVGKLSIKDLIKTGFWGGHHHMCATRMSDTPKNGVVDSNLKVHGLDNLYITGSSVFSTAGIATPTYTVVALSLRLADHLKKVI